MITVSFPKKSPCIVAAPGAGLVMLVTSELHMARPVLSSSLPHPNARIVQTSASVDVRRNDDRICTLASELRHRAPRNLRSAAAGGMIPRVCEEREEAIVRPNGRAPAQCTGALLISATR